MTPASGFDIPWCVDLCRRRYAEPMDLGALADFLAAQIADPAALFERTDRAFTVTRIAQVYFWPRTAAHMLILVADGRPGAVWDIVRLARSAKRWAAARGAMRLSLGAETGVDFAPVARAIGATLAPPCYAVALTRR